MIADATDISIEIINELFIESVRIFKLESELVEFAKQLVDVGVPIALVTNNMDIFNEVTIPTHHLDDLFSVIVNSADHGVMKHEADGKLFDIALSKLGITGYDGVFLIDDSEKACAMFESKGGSVYRYSGMDEFIDWKTHIS